MEDGYTVENARDNLIDKLGDTDSGIYKIILGERNINNLKIKRTNLIMIHVTSFNLVAINHEVHRGFRW